MKGIVFKTQLFTSPAAKAESEQVMALLLEALTRADQLYLRENPATPALYASGVRYQREPEGEEVWQGIAETLVQRWGDCEDLATWRTAELRMRGVRANPCFTSRVRADGVLVYHIMVKWPDGSIEDPSRKLGMGSIT